MKLGARIFKTGIAIVFALFLAEILQLPHPCICRNRSHFRHSTFYL